jgi:hypothetical protein
VFHLDRLKIVTGDEHSSLLCVNDEKKSLNWHLIQNAEDYRLKLSDPDFIQVSNVLKLFTAVIY